MLRQWGRVHDDAGDSAWWRVTGRNKRSVTVDLRRPEGQDLVRRLAERSEVLLENFRPGTLERWGLGWDVLSEVNAFEDVMSAVPRTDGVSYIGLVLNHRGAVRAAAAGVNLTVAGAFGCPYEGEVSVERVAEVAREVATAGVDELALGDTLGCAVPRQVRERVAAVRGLGVPLRLHLHETRHTGLANALAAVDAGVPVLDASAGGLGGCPFAPGAAGNVATQDLVWMLERSGITTGLDVDGIVAAGRAICAALGIEPRSGVSRAGAFPAAAARVH